MIDQLALALPDVQLLVNEPEDYIPINRWLAENRWPQPSRVTLVAEPGEIAPWTQDNGKAGVLLDFRGEPARFAVLAPRYATISERASMFAPIESSLMDGIQAAGHQVIQQRHGALHCAVSAVAAPTRQRRMTTSPGSHWRLPGSPTP